MHVIRTFGHLLGGTLLVAGTSIGVGMLALPVATAEGGFFSSLLVYATCWLFMLGTGLLILEASIWMPKEANLVTMASKLLGKPGKIACWVLYLFLFSCLMVAHVSGGGNVVVELSSGSLPYGVSVLLYTLAFAPAVYLGTLWVDRLNLVLMVGIVFSFGLFIFSTIPEITPKLLLEGTPSKAWLALPVVFTAFGYQSLIPTLMSYLNRDVKKMRRVLIMGTSIPFFIYILWQVIVLGIVPINAEGGLMDAMEHGENAVAPLGRFLRNPGLLSIGQIFAFFALTTSFIGISIGFVDFLADGLKVRKKGFHKLGLCALVFILPIIIALVEPGVFLESLNYGGGIGVALLLGAMPVLMIWSGRYVQGYTLKHSQLPGGKVLLALMLVFIAFELVITVMK
jgi:tyrosine-specific transport protein